MSSSEFKLSLNSSYRFLCGWEGNRLHHSPLWNCSEIKPWKLCKGHQFFQYSHRISPRQTTQPPALSFYLFAILPGTSGPYRISNQRQPDLQLGIANLCVGRTDLLLRTSQQQSQHSLISLEQTILISTESKYRWIQEYLYGPGINSDAHPGRWKITSF